MLLFKERIHDRNGSHHIREHSHTEHAEAETEHHAANTVKQSRRRLALYDFHDFFQEEFYHEDNDDKNTGLSREIAEKRVKVECSFEKPCAVI